jgi:hypothetical protein
MSLKGDKYETAEEVKFRLENTVVMYDEDPVLITRVTNLEEAAEKGEIARVFFTQLPYLGNAPKETRKYLSSKRFDLSPFKMGYMNYEGQAVFVSRTPVRQNKQGLCSANTLFTDIKGRKSEVLGFSRMLRTEGFVDMVKGKFPDFKVAGDMLDDKDASSVAVSRSFAFFIDHDLDALFLLNKGIRCGIAMRNDKAVKIPPKFHFLREEMEECNIPLC